MLGFFPKKRAGLAALLIAVSACAQTPPASVSGWTASVLLSVEGKVEVAAAGNTNWMVARTNQVLQVGDRFAIVTLHAADRVGVAFAEEGRQLRAQVVAAAARELVEEV